jgi:lysophospholipase L1-like esterase
MKRILRLVLVNIAVFIGLLILLNLAAVVIFRSYRLIKTEEDPRAGLPNYDTVAWAVKHFTEFRKLPAVYKSFVGWRRLPFSGETINIDENGIRATHGPSSSADSSRLAVFIGGSALWGTGSDDGNTIPSCFSKQSAGKYAALNFGESGYNAFQGYIYLKMAVMSGLKPDLVVAYEGANETDALLKDNKPLSHSRENQVSSALRGADRDEILSLRHYLFEPLSVFAGKIKNRSFRVKPEDYDLSAERLELVAHNFLTTWESERELTVQNNGRFIGVLQPVVYRGKPMTDHITADETMRKVYLLLYTTILEKLKKPEFSKLAECVLDPYDVFDGKEYIYIDDVHVSPAGNMKIAGKIYRLSVD